MIKDYYAACLSNFENESWKSSFEQSLDTFCALHGNTLKKLNFYIEDGHLQATMSVGGLSAENIEFFKNLENYFSDSSICTSMRFLCLTEEMLTVLIVPAEISKMDLPSLEVLGLGLSWNTIERMALQSKSSEKNSPLTA